MEWHRIKVSSEILEPCSPAPVLIERLCTALRQLKYGLKRFSCLRQLRSVSAAAAADYDDVVDLYDYYSPIHLQNIKMKLEWNRGCAIASLSVRVPPILNADNHKFCFIAK